MASSSLRTFEGAGRGIGCINGFTPGTWTWSGPQRNQNIKCESFGREASADFWAKNIYADVRVRFSLKKQEFTDKKGVSRSVKVVWIE